MITINSASGLEYIQCPNGGKIMANNKNKLSLDYTVIKGKDNYTFKIKEVDKEEKEEKVYVDDDYLSSLYMEVETVKNENGYKVFNINNKKYLADKGYTSLYYRVGRKGQWVAASGEFLALDYNIMAQNLENDDGTVTISARIRNSKNNNSVIVDKIYNIDTANNTETIIADSLIQAVRDYNGGSGEIYVTVNDQTYDLRLYQFDESKTFSDNISFGLPDDVGTSSSNAKKMAVVKVNGDLTIDNGIKITSYGTQYGGTKGLLIYCTGKFVNNGELSMTARGAKAVGQNIYLWKNTDGTYETVPAVGGAGGAGQSNGSTWPYPRKGKPGTDGTGRKTRRWWLWRRY